MKNSYFKYSALGMQMVITLSIFVGLGRYLDSLFEFHKPWFTLVLAMLVSFAMIIFMIKKFK